MGEERNRSKSGELRPRLKPRPVRQHACRNIVVSRSLTKSLPATLDRADDSQAQLEFLMEAYGRSQRWKTTGEAATAAGQAPKEEGCAEGPGGHRLGVGSSNKNDPRSQGGKLFARSSIAVLNEGYLQLLKEAREGLSKGEGDQNDSQAKADQTPGERQCARSLPSALDRRESEAQFLQFLRILKEDPRERQLKDAATEREFLQFLEFLNEEPGEGQREDQVPTEEENAREIECNVRSVNLDDSPSPTKNDDDAANDSDHNSDDFEDQLSAIQVDWRNKKPTRRNSGFSLPSHDVGEIDGGDDVPGRGERNEGEDEEEDALAALIREYSKAQPEEVDVEFDPGIGVLHNSVLTLPDDDRVSDMSRVTWDARHTRDTADSWEDRGTTADQDHRLHGLESVQEMP